MVSAWKRSFSYDIRPLPGSVFQHASGFSSQIKTGKSKSSSLFFISSEFLLSDYCMTGKYPIASDRPSFPMKKKPDAAKSVVTEK